MAAVPSPTFGTLLKRYRLAAGLTQEALAAQAGLSPRGISDLERGERRAPRQETLHLLAEALHLSAAERAYLEAAARGRARPPASATPSSRLPRSGLTPAAPLVGRTQELGLLERHLTHGPPLLLLLGEPGIGKSRLLQAGSERAEIQGWTVAATAAAARNPMPPWSALWPTECAPRIPPDCACTWKAAPGWSVCCQSCWSARCSQRPPGRSPHSRSAA